ncbi:type I secretion system permease/ATPase [Ottowia sp. VDI28]|uniref:type I secretion system permease/ATPase n=1 Tax=Ottowia sp. VDI28 TaxID=3133968 RepID=UPI003C2DF767
MSEKNADLFEQISLLTRLLGQPLSAKSLASQTLRNAKGGVDLQNLQEVLRSQGYENYLTKRPLERIPAAAAPVLVPTREGGALVVAAISHDPDGSTSYEILSEDGSRAYWPAWRLEEVYLGYCWFIKVPARREKRSELPEYTMDKGWFWRVIWRFKGYYAQVVVTSVVINVLALIGSLYVMNVYDRVIPNRAYETLWVLSIGVLVANLFEFIARTIRARLTDVAGKKADLIISSALFRRVLAMDLAHKPVSAGSYASNLREFESVRDFMTSASLLALVDLPFVLLFIGVMWVVAGPLALVPLLTIPLVVGVGLLAQVPLSKYTHESMRESSQRQGLAVEALEGLETLKTHNASNWAQQRWDRYTAATAHSAIKLRDWSNGVVHFSTLVQQMNTVFLVLVGTYLIHSDNPAQRITMGALIACVILSGRALAPLSQVAGLMARFQQARVALGGIDAIVDRPTERDSARSYLSLSRVRGELGLDAAGYRYGAQGPLVLKELNLRIMPGEKVAILGRIGSGKSTLLRLMAGLHPPSEGNVLLDGMDVRQIDPADVRAHVSLLGQHPRLFMGTLRDNLEMGRMDRLSSDEELITALRRFGLDKMVQSHPLGLNMPIGEDGHGLSGGQRQIVGLARLSLRDPSVVLLDEPTSGLDDASERAALQAVADWVQERTMVVVTHRPQVLPFVQRIVVIDQGRVVMDGPRDEVLQALRGEVPAVGAKAAPVKGRLAVQPRVTVVRGGNPPAQGGQPPQNLPQNPPLSPPSNGGGAIAQANEEQAHVA